jgi:RNA polymerase subunit RPABC4/transcription elongation factor Spt4
MKKKECPSCAMDIDTDSTICPICGFEFPTSKPLYKWIAIALVFLFLLYMIL